MPNQGFTLRVAVKTLDEEPFAGLKSESVFQVGSVRVSITQHSGYLILKAGDFVTAEEAARFLPHLKAGLWNLALEYNIAFIPDFEQRVITRSADPESAGRNIAASFGLSDLGPVHGLADEGGTVIFPSNENIRFLSMEGTARISTDLNNAVRVLSEGIESTHSGVSVTDGNLSTAFDLYLGHFYERSMNLRKGGRWCTSNFSILKVISSARFTILKRFIDTGPDLPDNAELSGNFAVIIAGCGLIIIVKFSVRVFGCREAKRSDDQAHERFPLSSALPNPRSGVGNQGKMARSM